ncbi:BTAD domain-containing putative transcriptional regulator [Pseudonocardia sp. TRM90224]|uniref:BTAD domain-containing putative transcriptional regulator n=1 Tax=Pseudonocardia sp. TRM90224 TaxID=2812678 RepID=UPI001E51A7F0|nr:BTAD domain-containing putative transcriptional regulator [Pseudonocardia sp. TRM90224]
MPSDPARVVVRVLGTFEAAVDGRVVALGGPRQRAVLARVLLGGATMVTADQIVTDVWGVDAQRSTTPGTVHAYVSRLRRLLGEDALPRRGGGYVLDRAVVDVDAELFAADVLDGKRALARSEDARAMVAVDDALGRWRGPRAFGDLAGTPFLALEGGRLEELRVAAAEMYADAGHRQGRSGEGIDLLEELAANDPLRESVAVRLVRSLHAADRQADALAAFDRCRRALADQLGVDPGKALQDAYAAVLARGEPERVVVRGTAGPTNIPPRNRAFVGRSELLDRLCSTLDDDDRRPRAVALTGLAGTGKTETALELVYRRRREGRVSWWIAGEDPTGVAAGLADLASALGLAHRKREQDTWVDLWNVLDRMPGWVIVFDNVDEPAGLAPFLPTAVHGDVVITSRNPAWRRLARPVLVPALDRPEATTYVIARSGDQDEESADALAELLGDLPLALEQACAYIEQTGMAVADYVRLFHRHRATLLGHGVADRPTVATTWGLAFDRLRARSPLAATVLETMSFLSADAVPVQLLAGLAADELALHEAIGALLRFSLVDRQTDVLRVHRLVQDVVRSRLPEPVARHRLAEASRLCAQLRTPAGLDGAHVVQLAVHSEAMGSVPGELVPMLATTAHHYAERALYPAAERILQQALRLIDVPDAVADPVARGALVCQLGEVLDASGRLAEALELHRDAVHLLESAARTDDVVLAHAHNRLGHVLNCADRPVEAIRAHERAIATLRAGGRDDLLPAVLVDLGYTLWAAGRLGDAERELRAGRDMLEQRGRRGSRLWAHATAGLGMAAQDRGDLAEALTCHRLSIAAFIRVSGADHPDTAQAFDKLGYTQRLLGETAAAVDAHLRAVGLLERVFGPDDARVAMALTNLGLAYADAGRAEDAVDVQSRAHATFLAKLGPEHASTLLAAGRWAAAMSADGQFASP